MLLLLLLGLEYSAAELTTGLRRSWPAGVLDIVLNAAPGVAVALALGWGPVGATVLGGVTSISSSGIVAKVLADLGRLGNRETPVILSVLVFEDLAMAVYLPILTAVLIGVSFLGGLEAVAISLAVVAVVLVVALRYGRYVSAVVDSPDREVFLLKVLGTALLVAGIASALQVSAAVGAFLLGIALSGSTAENATRLLEPLRDLFAAVFFVVFGLNTDPATIPPVLGWAVVLAVATTVTKLATGWWAAQWQGIGLLGRARAGAALIARGEFSIVIAGLAVSLRGGADRARRAGDGIRAADGGVRPDRGAGGGAGDAVGAQQGPRAGGGPVDGRVGAGRCSESGVECTQRTESRFRYIRRPVSPAPRAPRCTAPASAPPPPPPPPRRRP